MQNCGPLSAERHDRAIFIVHRMHLKHSSREEIHPHVLEDDS